MNSTPVAKGAAIDNDVFTPSARKKDKDTSKAIDALFAINTDGVKSPSRIIKFRSKKASNTAI